MNTLGDAGEKIKMVIAGFTDGEISKEDASLAVKTVLEVLPMFIERRATLVSEMLKYVPEITEEIGERLAGVAHKVASKLESLVTSEVSKIVDTNTLDNLPATPSDTTTDGEAGNQA